MPDYQYDIAVIGGGAAGLTAGSTAAKLGLKTAIVERDTQVGGILQQCIHNGFGLHYFHEELTGPEYAEKAAAAAFDSGCDIYTESTVIDIAGEPDVDNNGSEPLMLHCLSPVYGAFRINAGAVILAMGCRERNRGNIGIAGSRPAGIFTAGLAQRLMNINGCIPGREAVIIGSGDIGLIMARRLSWSGVKVKAVVEIMPYPAGLPRNLAQCLDDFNIPLYLNCRTTAIRGKDRVEAVDITPMQNGMELETQKFTIECDTVLLSVGLIPENELSVKAGVELNHNTGGPLVDSALMTSRKGIFACGNVLHVHDLVDFVSYEAEDAAKQAAAYLRNQQFPDNDVEVMAGANVKYVVPNSYSPSRNNGFYLRSMAVMERARLTVSLNDRIIYDRKLRHVKPAEMIRLENVGLATEKIGLDEQLIISLHELEQEPTS